MKEIPLTVEGKTAIGEEYKNSEVCQKCANCCKRLPLYFDSENIAMRMSWLDTDKFTIEKIKEDGWRVVINIPCKQLMEENGKYWCKKYNSPKRPDFCRTFPLNFKEAGKEVINAESKYCPLMKEVLKREMNMTKNETTIKVDKELVKKLHGIREHLDYLNPPKKHTLNEALTILANDYYERNKVEWKTDMVDLG